MRAWIVGGLGAIVVVVASACSSSDSSPSAQCTHASQCVSAQCVCNLGKGDISPPIAVCVDGTCETIDKICADHCTSNGGVKEATQVANVVGSSDCNAFCDRWSKDCGGPCAIQACNVGYCDAATKASLQCFATHGISDCENFLVDDPNCIQEVFLDQCPVTTDGGTDGDADAGADAGSDSANDGGDGG
jgi:hypothetical protein